MVDNGWGSALGELGPTLVVTFRAPSVLRRLCTQFTTMLRVTGCWITLADELDGEPWAVAATDPVARRLEALHLELGEGPGLEAAQTGKRVLLADLADPRAVARFPRFAARALAAGAASVHSFPLRTEDEQVGSLSLYSDARAGRHEVNLDLAQLLVDLAAVSVVAQRAQEVDRLAASAQRRLAGATILQLAEGPARRATAMDQVAGGTPRRPRALTSETLKGMH
jgi:hypothetical protein